MSKTKEYIIQNLLDEVYSEVEIYNSEIPEIEVTKEELEELAREKMLKFLFQILVSMFM